MSCCRAGKPGLRSANQRVRGWESCRFLILNPYSGYQSRLWSISGPHRYRGPSLVSQTGELCLKWIIDKEEEETPTRPHKSETSTADREATHRATRAEKGSETPTQLPRPTSLLDQRTRDPETTLQASGPSRTAPIRRMAPQRSPMGLEPSAERPICQWTAAALSDKARRMSHLDPLLRDTPPLRVSLTQDLEMPIQDPPIPHQGHRDRPIQDPGRHTAHKGSRISLRPARVKESRM